MPLKQCQKDGKPGWKWGAEGACYTYTPNNKESEARAMAKAKRQGRAVEASKSDEGNENE